ncbi:pyrophosphatase PpaX [Caldibacillus lycopersici]|uniref:Pyrophosphatase PpaX n=1 Tax=Perspicuibacillus lycopersici TaxID=1325689 RepID=A0AAE3LMM9_9BACI|nr:pyrophosphatase PpaX [Perspicuibacillus lycopersici]MCU9612927.1 pyrophosphatase PpaX [Perspicuibacillus lycopersici]
MKENIDTILFDLDGTLVNTYELIIQSFLHTFDTYAPNQYRREDCIPFIGPTLEDTFHSVLPEKAEEMREYYRTYNLEKHDELIQEFDGVYETLKYLYERGYKLAVVTTKMKDTAIKGLEVTNLKPFFSEIVGLDDITNAKPDPEPIYKALELLNSTPEKAMMVGDSHHDILAAKNAGVKSVGVSWSIKGKEYIEKHNPDFLIDNMKELLTIVGVE